MSGKVYEARKQGWLGVTLTQGEAKLWLQHERQQDSHAASLLFSLFCLKAFSSFCIWWHLHSLCICMYDGTRTLLLYGALALFLCFGGFFSHYVSVSSLLLSCHTSFA